MRPISGIVAAIRRTRGAVSTGMGGVTLSAHAFQSGARDVLIVSRRENVRSRRSIEAAGFRRVVTLTCWRLLNLVAFAGMGMPGLKRAGSIIHLSYEA